MRIWVLVLVASCSPREHWIRVDANVDADRRARIAYAANAWNEVSNQPIELVDEPCASESHCITLRRNIGARGKTWHHDEFVVIEGTMVGDEFTSVTMHEFGHLIGIGWHTDHGVMSERDLPILLTTEDLVACETANACD